MCCVTRAGAITTAALTIDMATNMIMKTVIAHAAMKKKMGYALGNVMGCNITNTLLVGGTIGTSAGVAGLLNNYFGADVAEHLRNIKVPDSLRPNNLEGAINWGAFVGSSALAVGILTAQGGKIKRWQGVTAAALYAGYLGVMTQVAEPLQHCHPHFVEGEMVMFCGNDNHTDGGNLPNYTIDGIEGVPEADF